MPVSGFSAGYLRTSTDFFAWAFNLNSLPVSALICLYSNLGERPMTALARSSSMETYLQQINETSLLGAQTENLLNKWRRGASRLHDVYGRAPSEEEISRHLRFSRRQFHLVQKALKILNLTALTDQESNGWTADERLADDRSQPPDHNLSR